MWLCTQHGFFSIVQKKPGEAHIRGRLPADMENLLKLFGTGWPIVETKSNDYRYRIVCGQGEVSEVMAKLATAIDYSNFKSRIHAKPDQADKSAAYSKLWGNLYELQG
jgi:hypothetical protein